MIGCLGIWEVGEKIKVEGGRKRVGTVDVRMFYMWH